MNPLNKQKIITIVLVIIALFAYQYFTKTPESTVEYSSNLIQQQIKNVSKLVVSEGHFAEVLTYKDIKKTIIPGVTFNKKALVVVNADVTVAFDLSKMKYEMDEASKTIKIITLPEEEIKIAPDYKYYDVEQSTFNEFAAEDYNKINKMARENLDKKIAQSSLKTNAKNRFISELSKILLVSHSIGWKVAYNGGVIENESQLQKEIKL